MITKTAYRLWQIERELSTTWLEFHVGIIPRSVANKKMQELEDEKERLL